MNKIVIITDSTADLSKELIEQRNIVVVPLKVSLNGKTYNDGVDMDSAKMYEIYEQTNSLPKTAAVGVLEFEELFQKYVNDETDVIYCGIGSKLSAALQSANIAKNDLDEQISKHIYLVDSGNLSTGIGLVVLKMCDMRDEGLSASEIVEKANAIVPCVRAQFSVKELTFLHKGGRCSGTARFFGTMLRIHPILRIFKGEIILSEKIFGKYEKALDNQILDIKNAINDVDDEYLFITHSLADEEAIYIYDNLPSVVKEKFKHIYITKAGCVISTHCGKHTIGILYIKKTPLLNAK